MDLTPDEQPVVRRAVAAYHEMKKGDAEFEIALDRFARNVEAGYDDLDKVTWRDENTMYVITRTDLALLTRGGVAQSLEPARPRTRGDLPT